MPWWVRILPLYPLFQAQQQTLLISVMSSCLWGPVTFFDTAGVDDTGELGEKRIKATQKILYRADIAIFVSDGNAFNNAELKMIEKY